MNLKLNRSPRLQSIVITIIIYIIILVAASLTYINQTTYLEKREIIVELREYEKKTKKIKTVPPFKKEIKQKLPKIKNTKKESLQVAETEMLEVLIDSNLVSENDFIDNKFNWIDSLVIANPNLQILKYASSEYTKNNPLIKSDSAKIVDEIKIMMQDYYKNKYPTPVHKFGDGSPGIAIDKIINIFKSDGVDEEKIKKYLKIGKYDKK